MSILSSASNLNSHSDEYWANYREKNFPVAKKWSYFDTSAVSPLSDPAHQAILSWLTEATHEGDTVWPQWAAKVEEIRGVAASLVNAEQNEIAFVPSTTFGISLVAEGLDWREGDNVVLPAGEFPSNLYPWMHLEKLGVELRIVPTGKRGEVTPQQIGDACDSRTRLVSSSWVGFASGYRIDPAQFAKVAHDHGALFFLDAIQGLGVFPLDVREANVDFFAADGHKWLMGPEGAGLFYCRHDLLDQLRPRVVGWNSVQSSYDFSKVELRFKDSAGRFEAGTQNMSGILGMGASLDLIRQTGVSYQQSPIATRVLELTELLNLEMTKLGLDCVSNREAEHASGIISFNPKDISAPRLRTALLEQGVVTSVRNDKLRFSPHAYCNEDDVLKAAKILTEL